MRITVFLFLFWASTLQAQGHTQLHPVDPDNITGLMAVDADLSSGLAPARPGGHGKFYVHHWTAVSQQATWKVTAPLAGEYQAYVVMRCGSDTALRLTLKSAGTSTGVELPAEVFRFNGHVAWVRLAVDGLLELPAGESSITLNLAPIVEDDSFAAEVHAVELVRPEVKAALDQQAMQMRADPTWFQQARFGIMVHWTSQSMPLQGEALPYNEAVDRFDVERFADHIQRTGAGFVVFTTSHVFQYFPAPLSSLERLVPGRTSQRDLVADLADALGRRGIRLMLYYHLGTLQDQAWCEASGLMDADSKRFFKHWQAIVSEAGNRYGEKLAGWWFDDGSVSYYSRSPDWRALAKAAKSGNAQRLISFNAWEMINPTQFHDFVTGEGCAEPRGFQGLVRQGGDGRYTSGSHEGLQASACLITERNWGHFAANTPLGTPKWSTAELASLLQRFMDCRNVPILNIEISQEGLLSSKTIETFEQATKQLGINPR